MRSRASNPAVGVTLTAILIVTTGALCHDSGSTGPGESGPAVDVTGTWEFQHAFSTAAGATVITAVLELEQDPDGRITGTSRNGRFEANLCGMFGCFSDFRDVSGGPVQGSVSGSEVVLEFNADDLEGIDRYEGSATEARMEGSGWTAVPGDGSGLDDEPAAPPAAPTSLAAEVVQTAEGPAVDLSWQDNADDEDGYAVAESCDGADWATLGVTGPNVVGVRVPGPFPGTECSYAVAAFREDGEDVVVSDASNVVTVTIP